MVQKKKGVDASYLEAYSGKITIFFYRHMSEICIFKASLDSISGTNKLTC